MRGLLRFLGTVILVAAVVVLVIFAVQNTQLVQATFAGRSFSTRLWWLVLGAAILGFLLAAILVTPGWISAGWRGRMLRRTTQVREQQIQTLRSEQGHIRAEHERLLAEHRQVVAERDRLRAGTGATQPVGPAAATPAPAASAEQAPRAGTKTTVYPANESPATGQTGQSTMGGPVAPQPQQAQQSQQAQRRQEEWSPDGPAVPTT